MKVALICIAKNEDNYINEWIKYHLLIGIDDIFIYQNDWKYDNIIKNEHVHLIEWNGAVQQLNAYNNFIQTQYLNFDFGIFIDADEFICLNQNLNIKDVLSNYIDVYGIAINWKNFGDSFLNFDNKYNILTRFTYAEKNLNKHIKTILNFKKIKNQVFFYNPHCVYPYNIIVNLEKTNYINGVFNEFNLNKIPIMQLNHYRKTRTEFNNRRKNGFPDQILTQEQSNKLKNQFDNEIIHYNEIQDFNIINYLKKINKFEEFNNL